MKKKIIFFDIDGTILIPGHSQVNARVIDGIKMAQSQGALCFIASGRPYGFVSRPIREIGFDGYVVANGEQVVYRDHNAKCQYLNPDILGKACRALRKKGVEYVLVSDSHGYIPRKYETLFGMYMRYGMERGAFVHDFDEEEVIHRTLKLEAWTRDEQEQKEIQNLCSGFSCEPNADHHFTEFYSGDCSKAVGICDVLKLLNIRKEESCCFGDGLNDMEMFQQVGHSVAMGNAIPGLKAIASEICPAVTEDGVAVKLFEWFGAK